MFQNYHIHCIFFWTLRNNNNVICVYCDIMWLLCLHHHELIWFSIFVIFQKYPYEICFVILFFAENQVFKFISFLAVGFTILASILDYSVTYLYKIYTPLYYLYIVGDCFKAKEWLRKEQSWAQCQWHLRCIYILN